MKVFTNLKKMMMPASNKKRKKVIGARKAKWRLIYFLHSPFFSLRIQYCPLRDGHESHHNNVGGNEPMSGGL